MKKELGGKASLDDLSRVEAETALLRSQVTAELTGARYNRFLCHIPPFIIIFLFNDSMRFFCRWLWRSGKIMKEGWIPWDTEVGLIKKEVFYLPLIIPDVPNAQVANAMPNALVWRSNSPLVLTRPAGLYRLCVSIFTSLPAMVQVRKENCR